jgi:hypothetical protein
MSGGASSQGRLLTSRRCSRGIAVRLEKLVDGVEPRIQACGASSRGRFLGVLGCGSAARVLLPYYLVGSLNFVRLLENRVKPSENVLFAQDLEEFVVAAGRRFDFVLFDRRVIAVDEFVAGLDDFAIPRSLAFPVQQSNRWRVSSSIPSQMSSSWSKMTSSWSNRASCSFCRSSSCLSQSASRQIHSTSTWRCCSMRVEVLDCERAPKYPMFSVPVIGTWKSSWKIFQASDAVSWKPISRLSRSARRSFQARGGISFGVAHGPDSSLLLPWKPLISVTSCCPGTG